jgi:hypothetical protein
MASTFDIRFARSMGLAALFESPANRFRWKGAGRLSIDDQGVSVAVRRGLPFLRRQYRRIAAGELTDVYREGEALRLEFESNSKREVLPIWATGSDTAAQIVKLLPTSRTVELDDPPAPASAYRFDRRVIAWLLGCAAGVALVSWALYRALAPPAMTTHQEASERNIEASSRLDSPPPASAPPAAASPAAAQVEPPAQVRPITRGSASYPAARRHVAIFEAELAERRAEYQGWLESPAPVDLVALERHWQQMVERINSDMNYQGPELWMLRDVQLGICRNWQNFLLMYAAGLRAHDSGLTKLGFMQREAADTSAEWLRWYVPR